MRGFPNPGILVRPKGYAEGVPQNASRIRRQTCLQQREFREPPRTPNGTGAQMDDV